MRWLRNTLHQAHIRWRNAWQRHPVKISLYVGLLALYLALALLTPTFWGLVLFPAAVLLVLWGAIRPEERFLRERFGAQYEDYARRVRRWL